MSHTLSTHVVSLTPFTEDGALDEDALRAHFQRLAAAGVGVYVAGGGTGEAFTLTQAEMRRSFEIAKEELVGKVPVRSMGTEPGTAAQMIEFARMTEEIGLDATHVYSLDMGHGAVPSEAIVATYLDDILSAVRSPVVLSSHHLSGYVIPVKVIRDVVDRYDNVIAMNVAAPQRYILQLIEAVGDRVDILVGVDSVLDSLALGARGIAIGEANVAPRLARSLIDHYAAGRREEAEEAYRAMMQVTAIARDYGGISGSKAALRLMGLPGGYPRKPRLDVSADQLEEIGGIVDRLKLREIEIEQAAV